MKFIKCCLFCHEKVLNQQIYARPLTHSIKIFHFQKYHLLAFLRPFDVMIWVVVALAIPAYGMIYGTLVIIITKLFNPKANQVQMTCNNDMASIGLFTFGAYFQQGNFSLLFSQLYARL